jgi:hypothetical protein
MKSLLKSRKFYLSCFGVLQALVLHYFQVPEEIWQAIAGLVAVLVASIAIEDAGEKSGTIYYGDPEIE